MKSPLIVSCIVDIEGAPVFFGQLVDIIAYGCVLDFIGRLTRLYGGSLSFDSMNDMWMMKRLAFWADEW